MSQRVVVIPADSAVPITTVTLDKLKYPALNHVLAEHHGGTCWMELVKTQELANLHTLATGQPWSQSAGAVMVVDEEGLLKRLPVNDRASLLYGSSGIIYGTALIVGQGIVDGESDVCGLPEGLTADKVIEYVG